MKPIQLSIPQPCHENWNNMTPAQKGRHCSSCNKEVVDFTSMNDGEVAHLINSMSGKVCGRFNQQQINRVLYTPAERNNGLFKHLWKLLLPGFFFSVKAQAQNKLPDGLQEKDAVLVTQNKRLVLGMVAMKVIPEEKKTVTFSGKVTDAESGAAIPGVSIQFKGTKKGLVTANDGTFSFSSTGSSSLNTIIVSALGYESKEVDISNLMGAAMPALIIELKQSEVALVGDVVVTEIKETPQVETATKKPVTVTEKYPVINDQVKIYPNPVEAGNSCALSFEKTAKGQYTAQLTDINGRLVQQSDFYVPGENYLFHLDINANVVPGAYLLRVMNASGKLFYNGKVMVQ